MEIPGSGIVSESLPALHHCFRFGSGELVNGRKSLEKAWVVLEHAGDLGLLEHELRDDHLVRVPGVAPRQVPRGPSEPGQEGARKPLCGRWFAPRGGRFSRHGYPRYTHPMVTI